MIDIESLKSEKVFDLTSLLKQYFLSLPEPLCTFNCFNELRNHQFQYDINCEPKEIISDISKLLNRIPRINRQTLYRMLSLLSLIAGNSHKNEMTTENLATLLAPTLFFFNYENMPMVEIDATNKFFIKILAIMIDNHDEIIGSFKKSKKPEKLQKILLRHKPVRKTRKRRNSIPPSKCSIHADYDEVDPEDMECIKNLIEDSSEETPHLKLKKTKSFQSFQQNPKYARRSIVFASKII